MQKLEEQARSRFRRRCKAGSWLSCWVVVSEVCPSSKESKGDLPRHPPSQEAFEPESVPYIKNKQRKDHSTGNQSRPPNGYLGFDSGNDDRDCLVYECRLSHTRHHIVVSARVPRD